MKIIDINFFLEDGQWRCRATNAQYNTAFELCNYSDLMTLLVDAAHMVDQYEKGVIIL